MRQRRGSGRRDGSPAAREKLAKAGTSRGHIFRRAAFAFDLYLCVAFGLSCLSRTRRAAKEVAKQQQQSADPFDICVFARSRSFSLGFGSCVVVVLPRVSKYLRLEYKLEYNGVVRLQPCCFILFLVEFLWPWLLFFVGLLALHVREPTPPP